jgi:hypothetical protein
MKTVLLLAASFLRQNRWLMLAFVGWPFLLAAFEWSPHHAANLDDVNAILQQEIFYGLAIADFLASAAIYNEKRSRRIVGVLSKSVSRAQYLLGLLGGSTVFGGVYFIAVAASLLWLRGFGSAALHQTAVLVICGIVASGWIAALALLFSVILHPLLAAAIAGIIGFAPLALANSSLFLPLTVLMRGMSSLAAPRFGGYWIVISLLESAFFVLIGSALFQGGDVAVNLE